MVPEGVHCISLGPQTPLEDIRRAALAHKVHIVALSFSAAFPLRQATDGLADAAPPAAVAGVAVGRRRDDAPRAQDDARHRADSRPRLDDQRAAQLAVALGPAARLTRAGAVRKSRSTPAARPENRNPQDAQLRRPTGGALAEPYVGALLRSGHDRAATGAEGTMRAGGQNGIRNAVSGVVQGVRGRAVEPRERRAVARVRCRAPVRRAGAHDQDERDHRVGGASGDRDVPARQPARQRLLRVHVDLVLRGAEARARADGVPQPVPSRPRADRSRTARGPVRVRSRAGVRDADAAFLRRDPPQPLVSLRVRVAHRARDQEDLRPHFPRRGASRRRVPALHEAARSSAAASRRSARSRRSAC